jgi:hypothetical protein
MRGATARAPVRCHTGAKLVCIRANQSCVTLRASASPAAPLSSTAPAVDAGAFETFLLETQASILAEAESMDGSGATFLHDRWERGDAHAGVIRQRLDCSPTSRSASSRRCPYLLRGQCQSLVILPPCHH